jgi:3-hydroxyisobutyrate dehydrogenase
MPEMTRFGWLGLGAMGEPMVRVAARSGLAIKGFDVDPAKRAIVEPNFTFVEGVGAAAAGADVLVVMVTSQAQVESVLFGDDPAADALAGGAIVVVMSTVGPSAIEDWAKRLEPRGISVVDAPVSGGVSRAVTGDLLVMLGGEEATIARAKPLFDAVAKVAPVVGPNPGDGQRVKLVNQLLCGVHIAAAAEALAFAEALQLDTRTAWEVIQNGAATSFVLTDRGSRMVSGEFDDVRSALDIWVKDMALVGDAAAALDYTSPLATLTRRLFAAASTAGLGRLDDSSIIQLFRAGRPLG